MWSLWVTEGDKTTIGELQSEENNLQDPIQKDKQKRQTAMLFSRWSTIILKTLNNDIEQLFWHQRGIVNPQAWQMHLLQRIIKMEKQGNATC